MIRVLLNVSSPAMRAGLRALLSSDATIKVMGDSLEEANEADVVVTSASTVLFEENGPAQAGGLFVGDTIIAVGGQPVSDPDNLFSVLNSSTVGQPIAVEVLRGGKPEILTVTVGERK